MDFKLIWQARLWYEHGCINNSLLPLLLIVPLLPLESTQKKKKRITKCTNHSSHRIADEYNPDSKVHVRTPELAEIGLRITWGKWRADATKVTGASTGTNFRKGHLNDMALRWGLVLKSEILVPCLQALGEHSWWGRPSAAASWLIAADRWQEAQEPLAEPCHSRVCLRGAEDKASEAA